MNPRRFSHLRKLALDDDTTLSVGDDSPIQETMVETRLEVPVPMTQVVVVQVPTIAQQARQRHIEGEQIVGMPVPQMQEDISQVPMIVGQARQQQQEVEQIVHTPKILLQTNKIERLLEDLQRSGDIDGDVAKADH